MRWGLVNEIREKSVSQREFILKQLIVCQTQGKIKEVWKFEVSDKLGDEKSSNFLCMVYKIIFERDSLFLVTPLWIFKFSTYSLVNQTPWCWQYSMYFNQNEVLPKAVNHYLPFCLLTKQLWTLPLVEMTASGNWMTTLTAERIHFWRVS